MVINNNAFCENMCRAIMNSDVMILRNKRTARMNLTEKFLTWVIAFAMILTMMPSAFVCAADENTDPTGTASDMTEGSSGNDGTSGNEDGQNPNGDDSSNSGDASTGSENRDASPDGSSSETDTPAEKADTTSTSSTTETTATTTKPAVTTTTINTSNKKWFTPRGNKTMSLTLCRNTDGTVFDLMKQAGQKLYQYDTLQGASAGKGYAYFTLYNRKNNRVKIVKVRLCSMEVVKVSGALKVHHANEITYNGRKNIIVVANSTPKPKRLTVIDANTLKIKYHKTLKVTKKVKGMSKSQRKKFKGVGAIAYNEKHDIYVCRMRKSHDLLFLNSNLKPYKRVRQNAKLKLLYQGMDSYKDCIMIVQSFKGKKKYDAVTIYNMKGKKIARFTIGAGKPMLELQTVFHDGNQFYAGAYFSYGAKADLQKLHVKRENRIYRINNL